MKKLISTALLILAAVFCFNNVQAEEVDMKDPYKMVSTIADDAFEKLKLNKDKIKDVAFRKELVRVNLLPYIDTRYAGYKVMGTYLKKSTAKERDDFCNAFAEYIVASFADALAMYNDQKLVLPEYKKVSADATQLNVKFFIRDTGKKDIELVFKLRKNSKTGEWRAYDMVSEGISMLTAKENELAPLIRERGIKTVTDLINKHNQAGSTEAIK